MSLARQPERDGELRGPRTQRGGGEKEKMARWKAKVRRTGSWRWRTAAGRFRGLIPLPPCVPPGPWANSVVGTVRRPLWAVQARLPASNRTTARIQDTQDCPGQALCPTRLNPPEQAARTACGAQSLPYGTRTRRLFSNFATPNGEATLPNRDKTHNTWHFAVTSVWASSRFLHLDRRAGRPWAKGDSTSPRVGSATLPPPYWQDVRVLDAGRLLFSIALSMVLATFLRHRLAGGAAMFDGAAAL